MFCGVFFQSFKIYDVNTREISHFQVTYLHHAYHYIFSENFCSICLLNRFLFSNLVNDFLLVKGELQVPFGLVSGNVLYKYIVFKMGREKGEEGKYLWEHIIPPGPFKNRCLCIPKDRCHIGGTCRAQ